MPTKTRPAVVDAGEALPEDPIELERARIAGLHAVELEWCDTYAKAQADLADVERDSGHRVLENRDNMSTVVDVLLRVREEAKVAAAAIDAARRERALRVPLVWRLEAERLREQAAAKRAEADQREPKTAELLQALQDWEDCRYVPDPGANMPWSGNLEGGAPVIIYVAIPLTQRLRNDAAALERQAEQLELRQLRRSGTIEAASREDLLAKVREYDPLAFAPSLVDVIAWFDEGAEQERKRRASIPAHAANHVPVDAPVPCFLEWDQEWGISPRSFVGSNRRRW